MTTLRPILPALMMLIAGSAGGQNFNRPVPNLVPAYEFIQYDSTYHGYYLTAPFQPGASISDTSGVPPKPAMILDANGYLLWYMPVFSQNLLDFKYHPAEQVYSLINYKSPEDIRFTLLDTQFASIDSFTSTGEFLPDLHEFNITRSQTYLLAGISDSIMDLSNFQFNGSPGSSTTHVIGYVVQEFDQEHQLLFQWNSNEHIHPILAYGQYGYNPAGFDYCHGNAIVEDQDGHLLLSFRNLNAVYKIHRTTGQVLWRLGGKNSSFTFANDPGFSAQHDIQRLPGGHITIFDNANMAQNPKISRAVEYSLDTINWVATKVWEYAYDPGFLSPAMGNHQTTSDRHHLVNYGFVYRPAPSFVLVNDDGNLASELIFRDSFMSYRSFIFDLPLDQIQRPVITCSQHDGNVTLSAPAGFGRYAWSDGGNEQEITVNQPGAYQVWVNDGPGMLGSDVFIIQDINNTCTASATVAPESFDKQQITGIYDLLGRQVAQPVAGELYAVRYSNGLARWQFWTE